MAKWRGLRGLGVLAQVPGDEVDAARQRELDRTLLQLLVPDLEQHGERVEDAFGHCTECRRHVLTLYRGGVKT